MAQAPTVAEAPKVDARRLPNCKWTALLAVGAPLVLDERTSALDPETERDLVAALREASRNRHVLVIAHQRSTVRAANRIHSLSAGRIRESGRMTRDDGAYRRFVELQTRGAA